MKYETDKEYFTGRYWNDGKKIYIKIVDCGNISANTTNTIPHNITNIDRITGYKGIADIGSSTYVTLPYLNTSSLNYSVQIQIGKIDNIVIRTVNYALSSIYVTMFYTKTTD